MSRTGPRKLILKLRDGERLNCDYCGENITRGQDAVITPGPKAEGCGVNHDYCDLDNPKEIDLE